MKAKQQKAGAIKLNISAVVRMRDALAILNNGLPGIYRDEDGKEQKIYAPFVFGWDFKRRLAHNFEVAERAIAAFEASRDAIVMKLTGKPGRLVEATHPKYPEWEAQALTLMREEVPLDFEMLGFKEFNGDQNTTLPADIIVKLRPIIDMNK